jgi:hypothetical protein
VLARLELLDALRMAGITGLGRRDFCFVRVISCGMTVTVAVVTSDVLLEVLAELPIADRTGRLLFVTCHTIR